MNETSQIRENHVIGVGHELFEIFVPTIRVLPLKVTAHEKLNVVGRVEARLDTSAFL